MLLFLLVFLVMCFFYPPMVGVAISLGGYCLLWWVLYWMMGGE
jgi:hypothetical protein